MKDNTTSVFLQLIASVLFYFFLYFSFALILQTLKTSSNQLKNECEGGANVKIFLKRSLKIMPLACQQECIDIVNICDTCINK